MPWKRRFGGSVAAFLGCAVAAPAQTVAEPRPPLLSPPPAVVQVQEPGGIAPGIGADAPVGIGGQSRLSEQAESTGQPEAPKLGPTPVDDVGFLMNTLGLKNLFGDSGIRTYGWVEGGYTYSSGGPGLMAVEPRENRFGNEYLLNQIGIVLERPLKQENRLNFGFNVTYYAGADAALLQPKGGLDYPPENPRFSDDFRNLYVSAHLPILTEGGVDLKVGRMGTIIGYNGALAPYRPFYSSDYQWFYSQDGAWTGFLTNWHVNKQLDILNGMTLGANTFFTKRSDDSYCYIGQVNYWLTEEKKTMLTASVQCGPDAIFAAPGLNGDFDTIVELRVLHNFNEYFTQVIQSNMGWDSNTPVGTGAWYGVYGISIVHLNCTLDVLARYEWFDDVNGTRTGIAANYAETTLGFNWHPNKYLEVRPELRGDFADQRAFGTGRAFSPGFVPLNHSQLTAAMSAMIKF